MRASALLLALFALAVQSPATSTAAEEGRTNFLLIMADDLGWGDTGYNGHEQLKTPHLDRMAAEGLQFNRFYSAAPVCSPTRGSFLTGRSPFRYGVHSANVGRLEPEEISLAEVLQPLGYATGHFGKWHLGTLTNDVRDGRRGGRNPGHYSPPWENGFEKCFSTEVQMPTWNPMENQNFPAKYWTGPGEFAKENLEGDDSRVIVDRAVAFLREAAASEKPFFAVVWFHTPHEPVVAGPEHRAIYSELDENHQHYYGCITAMDEQIGRMRAELRELGCEKNTLVFFCSDNGPAAAGGGPGAKAGGRQQGSACPYRGRKGSVYEEGIRVPGLIAWPAMAPKPRQVETPCVTSDLFPTVLEIVGKEAPQRPYDGISLVPLLKGEMEERPAPIAFQFGRQRALSDNRLKLYSADAGKTWELFDLVADPGEQSDISAKEPERTTAMAAALEVWEESCRKSEAGADYAKPE